MIPVTIDSVTYGLKFYYEYDKKGLYSTEAVLSHPNLVGSMVGTSFRHTKDQPDKVLGRTLAILRMAQHYLEPHQEKQLWQQLSLTPLRLHTPILATRKNITS